MLSPAKVLRARENPRRFGAGLRRGARRLFFGAVRVVLLLLRFLAMVETFLSVVVFRRAAAARLFGADRLIVCFFVDRDRRVFFLPPVFAPRLFFGLINKISFIL